MTNGNGVERFVFPDTGQQVRTVILNGEPWIVARDVCEVLGLSNVTAALTRLDDDEFTSTEVIDSAGRRQQTYVVTEPGLYGLILASRKPEALAFKRWIKHELLPTFRRTGSYSVAPSALPDITTPQGQHAVAQMLVASTAKNLELAERIAELEPEAARAAQTLDADGLALVGTVAKRFGLKEIRLRQFLYAEGLLIERGTRRNEPMARYIASGHFKVKVTLVDVHPDRAPVERSVTYVTPKGEALVWKRLYEAGVVGSPRPPARQLELAHT
ncbi:BRO family protein [Microbispora sp. NPDC088329]|uniref:BRO family protein n=1 Tax=Microbispora sp. NPDC088329 TaxID=3154869 RepID=UPI0034174B76